MIRILRSTVVEFYLLFETLTSIPEKFTKAIKAHNPLYIDTSIYTYMPPNCIVYTAVNTLCIQPKAVYTAYNVYTRGRLVYMPCRGRTSIHVQILF